MYPKRKKSVKWGLALLGGMLVMAMFWFASPPTDPVSPAVTFNGYTNSAAGGSLAVFVISNRAPETLNLSGIVLISSGQSLMANRSMTRLIANSMRLAPSEAVMVAIPRPEQRGAWQASFSFLPARPNVLYSLKMLLHRAGVRGINMGQRTIDATSDLIE